MSTLRNRDTTSLLLPQCQFCNWRKHNVNNKSKLRAYDMRFIMFLLPSRIVLCVTSIKLRRISFLDRVSSFFPSRFWFSFTLGFPNVSFDLVVVHIVSVCLKWDEFLVTHQPSLSAVIMDPLFLV